MTYGAMVLKCMPCTITKLAWQDLRSTWAFTPSQTFSFCCAIAYGPTAES